MICLWCRAENGHHSSCFITGWRPYPTISKEEKLYWENRQDQAHERLKLPQFRKKPG